MGSFFSSKCMKNKLKLLKLAVICCAITFYACGSGEFETGETKQEISGNPNTETPNKPETEKQISDLPNKGLFTIQLGAFVDEANAISLSNSVKKFFGDEVNYSLKGDLYKVRLGLFTSETEASAALEKIKKQGFEDAFIVIN